MDKITKLKYDNISYIVDIETWNEIENLKINKWKLDESDIIIDSSIEHPYNFNSTKRNHLANTIYIKQTSFHKKENIFLKSISIPIKFKNFNIEKNILDFQTNFNDNLNEEKEKFLEKIMNSDLNDMFYGIFILHVDLKTHIFKYIIDFPTFFIPNSPIHVQNRYSGEEIESLLSLNFFDFLSIMHENNNLCIIDKKSKTIKKLTKETILNSNMSNCVICMIDYSNSEYIGKNWINLINAIRIINPNIQILNILAIRNSWESSLFLECQCDILMKEQIQALKVKSYFDKKLQTLDLSKNMEPIKMIELSSKLNLNLMKWRMSPNIQLEELSKCKALLLGSGTLGCNIARNLLMWGVNHITFVDKGTVSYSNPVRQTLFEFNDCLKIGEERIKSIVAAEAIKRILPSCECKGINLKIPMPGHRIDNDNISNTIEDIKILENLILEHDVIFLLTDSREARWLPTLLCSVHNKPVINVALGFDTFVVMRHGLRDNFNSNNKKMGCYFCNDVIAPVDSLSGRTIDQQCTITRPGLSSISSAIAVEILASIYNHPQKFLCPSHIINNRDKDNISESVIGIIPHQIRGELYNYSNTIMYGENYDRCVACSDIMMNKFKEDKYNFIIKCINEDKYMEKICGLDFLNNEIIDIIDIIDMNCDF